MKLATKILVAKAILNLMILRKRTPLLVGWALTNKCNLRCKYCNTWNFESEELTTKQIFSILDELSRLGCARIAFTGGEPLLRDDIGEIVSYCKNKGIYTGINSNGFFVVQKIDQIKQIDLLMLSLDGPEEIHDFLRGNGSYKKTIEAIDIAKKCNIKVNITTVLTKFNLKYIDFVLEKAKSFSSFVYFQPVTNLPLGAKDISELLPSQNEFRNAVEKLLKAENNFIGNSRAVLKHFLNWPKCIKFNCKAGQIYCAIDAGGFLYACSNLINSAKFHIATKGFKQTFSDLEYFNCKNCWCASPLEINILLSFNIFSLLHLLKKE